ncbi:MAG: GspH/FimT family pseudopilin [Gemmatimonadota bacterium]
MRDSRRTRGFSAIEMVTALVVVGIVASMGIGAYGEYARKTTARRAAEVFAADLALARSTAIRGRQTVSLTFDETGLAYSVVAAGGAVVLTRAFGVGSDLRVDALDLEMAGDSLTFNSRGFADLSGASGSVGRAAFRRGEETYAASFNALGASRVTVQ